MPDPEPASFSDEELWALCSKGGWKVGPYFDDLADRVYRLARSVTHARKYFWAWPLAGASADDACQDSVAKVFRSQFDPSRGKFAAWVTTIAHNVVIDYVRSISRRSLDVDESSLRRVIPLEDAPEQMADDDPAAEAADSELKAALDECKKTLGPGAILFDPRRTIVEIAEILGISEVAARVRRHRALPRLRRCLEARGFGATDI